MLHLRDRASLPWSWLSASDPGLLRLQMAARGTLAVTLNTAAAIGLGHIFGLNPVEFAAGIVFSLMAPFLMREPTGRQRRRTLAALTVPAALTTVGTAFLHGYGQAGPVAFLALVFACFLFQARSARGIGLGLVAIVGMYVGLYLKLPPATLPVQLLSLVLAVPLTALACFVLVPIRPAWTLRRAVHAVQTRAAAVLGAGTQAQRSRGLARLNEAALAADDYLTLLSPGDSGAIRLHLVALELAVARLMEADSATDPRLLRLQGRRLRHGRWTARHLGHPGADLARAAAGLGAAIIRPDAFTPPAAPPLPPGPLAWRVAFRVTLASALAMAGGMALSDQRWFWAVITTYVVMLGARSRGDTMVKGAQRLGGTVLGLVGGLLLATAIGGNPAWDVAGLLLATFGMYYTFLVSYTQGIFCVTVLLGLLYSAMGSTLAPLLVLRLEETAIGTAAAILVSLLVLPARTRDQVARSGQGVLAGVEEVVRCSRLAWAGEAGPSPLDAMRALDRKVADLRLALVPLTAGRALLRAHGPGTAGARAAGLRPLRPPAGRGKPGRRLPARGRGTGHPYRGAAGPVGEGPFRAPRAGRAGRFGDGAGPVGRGRDRIGRTAGHPRP